MAETLPAQIENLRASIAGLEAQRAVLGDAIVNPALAALHQQLSILEAQVVAQAIPAEERRLVTILFADIVGSTSLAEKLDPEEWRRIVEKVHVTLGKVIFDHHGTIGQYLGDGLLAFFGARQSSEHDPENAVRSALDGQQALANLSLSEKLQLRFGVHTGLVVVGDLGENEHKEYTATGDAVNLAARLQSSAPPGGILISHDTYRYIRGVFDVSPRPIIPVKGKSEPVKTYLVRRAKPRPFRSVTRGVAGVETRTIGRETEMQALQAAYICAFEQHATIWAQLMSEPGVGKSRLMEDMGDWLELREETYRLLRARAFPDDINQHFALVRRLWFDRFQIADDTPLDQAEKKWVERFKELSGQLENEEAAHALGLLVGLPFQNSHHIGAMRNDPTQVKGRALVVSRDLIKAVQQHYPVVLFLEDLQWADIASWEYLMGVFLEDTRTDQPNGAFILGAARPDWHPPNALVELTKVVNVNETSGSWGTLVSLTPLSNQSTRELARELFQRVDNIPDQLIDLIVERSEGVPYFAEEIVNWMVDHGILEVGDECWRFHPDKLREQPLPATLQHLLLTRLSSLSPTERAALQRGAIFGRRFWTGGVEALGISGGAEMLGHLQPRGFVEAQPESSFQGDTEWSFHHNLLQEVTYESVLKRERAVLHKEAAGWLERQARQAGRLDEFAGLLGEHYERAGELSNAVDWYLLAGKRAMGQGASREAKDFFTKALELLPPVDRERRWQALLGREEAYTILSEPDLRKADIVSMLDLAQLLRNDQYLAKAYYRQALFGLQIASEQIVQPACLAAIEVARRCGNDLIEIETLAVQSEWDIYKDKNAALNNIDDALRRARCLGDNNVLADILYRAAFCYSEAGIFARLFPLLIEQIELSHKLGDRFQEASGLGNLGASYITIGLYKQARQVLKRARRIHEDLEAHRDLAYHLGNLGESYLATGDLRQTRTYFEQGLEVIRKASDARGTIFALLNLGRLLLIESDFIGAARRFTEVCQMASSQGMSFFVWEATIGLAFCAAMQGQVEEARRDNLEAWGYLRQYGWTGMGYPGWTYHTCAETFDILGDTETMWAVIESGHQALLDMAEKVDVPEWRQSFLENVPDHRWIMETWEHKAH
jgi:class 3 adenylate cyclase/predicted ATPase